jgi:hypothetical protein
MCNTTDEWITTESEEYVTYLSRKEPPGLLGCSSKAVPLHTMQRLRGGTYIDSSYPFLTSAQDVGEWWSSGPSRALSQGEHPGTHWIGGWVGLRTDLNTEDKSFISWGSNPGRPVCSQSLYWLSRTSSGLTKKLKYRAQEMPIYNWKNKK